MYLTMVPMVVCVLFLCIVFTSSSGVCPESKRRYPGDCRLFYRCVPLPMPMSAASATATLSNPEVAHAHIWVPTRCTAGLVFQPHLKKCVLPDDNWDCNNDDQLIAVAAQDFLPVGQSEDTTEEMHIAMDKSEEYNMIIPNIVDIVSQVDQNSANINIMDNIDRTTMSTTLDRTPSRYHTAITRLPYVPVNNQTVDQIATQMDRIADMAHNLKAVAHTDAPPQQTAWNRMGAPSAPVTMTHDHQIPTPAGLHQLMNTSTHFVTRSPYRIKTHFVTERPYGVNLAQFNKITEQLMQAKQSPISVNAQQHLTNINLFGTGSGSGVLKQVEQSTQRIYPSSIDKHNTAHVVSTLFNKYLANKSFTRPSTTYKPPIYSSSEDMMVSASRREPVTMRLQFGYKKSKPTTTTTTEMPLPCVSGVRLANATDCRRYYMCNSTNALIHSYTCPPYTAFNKVRRMCDVAQYAYCSNPSFAEDNIIGDRLHLIRQQEQLPSDICAIRDKLPDPTSTRRYILCLKTHNGKWIRHQMTCPGSLIYCPHRNLCTPASNCYYY